jgi:hypothetical protein
MRHPLVPLVTVSTVFRSTRWALLCFMALNAVAMFIYPGGTFRDPSTRSYSFFQNFLSDLAMTVTWGGHPNYFGASLIITGDLATTLVLLACGVAFATVLSSSESARHWARAAGVAGTLSCVGLIVAALAPADRFLALHIQSALLAFRAIPVASLLFTVATIRDVRFPRRSSGAFLLLTILMAAYVVIIEWGPRPNTDRGLIIQVTAQKISVVAVLLVFAYGSWEAERVSAQISGR